MADGFIVRRGGRAAEQTATPSILDFSTASATEIKFKLRNNDAATATLVYRFGTVTGEGENISLATNTTSSEITLIVPEITAPTKLFVTANATGKVKSEVAEQEFSVPTFTAATGGTTLEYDSGGKRYRSHTFTSDGDFTVTTVGETNDDRNKVDFLVIAGGASGGRTYGGGGGAGGYITSLGTSGADSSAVSKITVTAKTYNIVVGAGGTSIVSVSERGNSGTNSEFDTIIALGGGGGGIFSSSSPNFNGINGGSGGGAGTNTTNNTSGTPGSGTANQGRNGGSGAGVAGSDAAGGGGGGASNTGANAANLRTGGNGGNGLANLLRTGSNETRAGGGGGSGGDGGSSAVKGLGGAGGGGNGGRFQEDATSGTVNTGSGGGGTPSSRTTTGAGGSGIVVIRYEIAPTT
jgi:hypothetical protein